MLNTDEIRARLRKLREDRHLTRDKLAEELGVDGQSIKGVETGRTLPVDMLDIYREYFGVSVEYMLYGENESAAGQLALLLDGIDESKKEIALKMIVASLEALR